MAQQTAVDYLIEQLWAPCRGIPSHIIEQAKQMEKEQLVKARKITLWSVSEEGFLLKLDQLVAITPSMKYILVQDKGYTKWGDNSEDRWNHFYLFPAEKASY